MMPLALALPPSLFATSALAAPQQIDRVLSRDNVWLVLLAVAAVLVLFSFLMLIVRRYKRCPSNKILVIFGKVRDGHSARCLHGGGAFVWPLIQDWGYLPLDPMQIEIPLRGALSIENIRVNVPSVFTVAIGTEPEVMQNAAVRLLGLSPKEIVKQAEDIIFGQLRQVIASMRIEDINRDRDKFLSSIHASLAPELEKIGLVLINVNITDITDESGYIEAIGRKAASEAIQQAEIDVALQMRHGSIGVADADRERDVQVAQAQKAREIGTKEAEREKLVQVAILDKETAVGQRTAQLETEARVKDAEREMRVKVAEADAQAVAGESLAKARIAEAQAALRVKEADAFQLAETRRREADAAVRQAQYVAEARTAEAFAEKIEREKRAELEAVARAAKAKQIVDAEAKAEGQRLEAEGEAAAIFARLEAQARGQYELMAKKADGLRRIVESCGGAQPAFQLLLLEQLPKLSETAASAIANIKFDKIVVWDGGAGDGHAAGNGVGGGRTAVAGFLHGLAGALPPVLQMMRDVGGVDLPPFFGRISEPKTDAVTGMADGAADGASVAAKRSAPAP